MCCLLVASVMQCGGWGYNGQDYINVTLPQHTHSDSPGCPEIELDLGGLMSHTDVPKGAAVFSSKIAIQSHIFSAGLATGM